MTFPDMNYLKARFVAWLLRGTGYRVMKEVRHQTGFHLEDLK